MYDKTIGIPNIVTKQRQTYKYDFASRNFFAPKAWLINICPALFIPLTIKTFISELYMFPNEAALTYVVDIETVVELSK